MNIEEIMTKDVVVCQAGDKVQEAALKMKQNACGLIVVIEENGVRKPIGVITDRDITCRVVAPGDYGDEVTVGDVMSADVINIHYRASSNAAIRLMETHSVRRLVVTSDGGGVLGILSLTDLARGVPRKKLGEIVQVLARRTE